MVSLDKLMEIEEWLQDHKIFYNGIRGKDHRSHSDSYMTCVNFAVLDAIIDSCPFSEEEIDAAIEYWLGTPSPPLRLVALTWQRKLEGVRPIKKEEG